MAQTHVQVEAPTLEEALEKIATLAKEAFPDQKYTISNETISDGRPQKISAHARSIEAAEAELDAKLPSNAQIVARRIVAEPNTRQLAVDAFDSREAWKQAVSQIPSSSSVGQVVPRVQPKAGFLGLGRRIGRYDVAVHDEAKVEATYTTPACFRAVATRVNLPAPPFAGKNTIHALSIVTNVEIPRGQAEAWVQQIIKMSCKFGVYEDLMEKNTKIGFVVAGSIDFLRPASVVPALLISEHISDASDITKLTFGDFSDSSSGIRGSIVAHFRQPL